MSRQGGVPLLVGRSLKKINLGTTRELGPLRACVVLLVFAVLAVLLRARAMGRPPLMGLLRRALPYLFLNYVLKHFPKL